MTTNRIRLWLRAVNLQVVATIATVWLWPVSPDVSADDATPDATPALIVDRLFADAPGFLDPFGRVPLSRLTVAPGAALDLGALASPIATVVESGTFAVVLNGVELFPRQGRPFHFDAGDSVTISNTGEEAGSWLILVKHDAGSDLRADVIPYSYDCDSCPAPGVRHDIVFRRQDVFNRLRPVRFAVDRVTLLPGNAIESVDFGGETDPLGFSVLVESGAIELTASDEIIGAGSSDPTVSFGPDDLVPIHVSGTEAAVMLVVRTSEPTDAAP